MSPAFAKVPCSPGKYLKTTLGTRETTVERRLPQVFVMLYSRLTADFFAARSLSETRVLGPPNSLELGESSNVTSSQVLSDFCGRLRQQVRASSRTFLDPDLTRIPAVHYANVFVNIPFCTACNYAKVYIYTLCIELSRMWESLR